MGLERVFADEVEFVLRRGLMEWTPRSLRLTADGALNVNGVIALFFAPSLQQYLIERDPDRGDDLDRHRLRAEKVAGEMARV